MRARLRATVERLLGTDRLGSLFRGSALVMLTQVAGIGLAYLMQVVIARWAGPFAFGVFAYAWTWMNLIFLVAACGLNDAALRLIPAYATQTEWAKLRGMVIRGPAVVAALGAAAGLGGALVIFLLGDHIGEHYRTPLLWTFCAAPLFGLLAFYQSVGRALDRVFAAFLPRYIGLPALVLLAVGGFAMLGRAPDAEHLVAATVAACGLLALIQGAALTLRLPAPARQVPAESPLRDWLRLSAPLLFIAMCYGLLTHCDLLMVGFFLSADEVAVYQAASRTAALISFPLLALSALIAPMIARLHAENRLQELQRVVTIATQVVFWPSVLAALVAVAAGKLILGLFGAAFETGQLALTILVLGQVITVGSRPVTYLMTMTGHQDRCAVVWAMTVAGQFAVNLLLIPHWGIAGAAIGTMLATCFLTIALTVQVQRRLNISAHALVPVRQTVRQTLARANWL